jgi:hypothetical protein
MENHPSQNWKWNSFTQCCDFLNSGRAAQSGKQFSAVVHLAGLRSGTPHPHSTPWLSHLQKI